VNTATPSIAFDLSSYFLLSQNATCWISRSASTGFFYGSNAASASLTKISRSGNIITEISSLQITGAKPIDNAVVTLNNQDYVLQLSASEQIFVVSVGNTMNLIQTVNLQAAYAGGIAIYTPSSGYGTTTMGAGTSNGGPGTSNGGPGTSNGGGSTGGAGTSNGGGSTGGAGSSGGNGGSSGGKGSSNGGGSTTQLKSGSVEPSSSPSSASAIVLSLLSLMIAVIVY